jgi:hypothetical protein
VPPGNPLRLAEAIRNAHDGRLDLEDMGRRARAYAESQSNRSIAIGRYRDVLRELELSS